VSHRPPRARAFDGRARGAKTRRARAYFFPSNARARRRATVDVERGRARLGFSFFRREATFARTPATRISTVDDDARTAIGRGAIREKNAEKITRASPLDRVARPSSSSTRAARRSIDSSHSRASVTRRRTSEGEASTRRGRRGAAVDDATGAREASYFFCAR